MKIKSVTPSRHCCMAAAGETALEGGLSHFPCPCPAKVASECTALLVRHFPTWAAPHPDSVGSSHRKM